MGEDYRHELASAFCCQRTVALILSEPPSIPLRTLYGKSAHTNKKPGVERRAQPLLQVILREARQILARGTRKVPHYRIGRTATDPTVNPLIGLGFMGKPRTICEYTRFPVYVKSFLKIIFRRLCGPVQNRYWPLWELVFTDSPGCQSHRRRATPALPHRNP